MTGADSGAGPGGGNWTRLERRAALNRAVRERREDVLAARFDDAALPGLWPGMVAVDLRGRARSSSPP